jgi:tetratricopeptide (TPR) repeat protein
MAPARRPRHLFFLSTCGASLSLSRILTFITVLMLFAAPPLAAKPFHILGERLWNLSYTAYIENTAQQSENVEIMVTLPPSESPSQEVLSKKFPSPPIDIEKDGDGNEFATWAVSLKPGEKMLLGFSCKIRTRHVRWDGPLNELPESRRHRMVDLPPAGVANSPPPQAIIEAAKQIAGDERYPYYRALSLYDYLLSHYQFNPHEKKYGALEALGKKIIQCADAALLYAELTRASGIPSRFVGGIYVTPGKCDYNELHAWTEIMLPGCAWATVDPTLGRFNESQRLKCFMERRANYICLWKGILNPVRITGTQKGEKVSKTGATLTLRAEELRDTGSHHVKEPANDEIFDRMAPRPEGSPWLPSFTLAAYEHYAEGRRLEEEEKPERAMAEYCTAMNISPDFQAPLKGLLHLYSTGQKMEDIHEELKKKSQICSKDPLVWYGLGELERRAGNYGASAYAYDRAEKNGFANKELYFSKMCLYGRTKELRLFDGAFRSCIALNCRNLEAYRSALLFYQDLELWDRCLYVSARGEEKIPGASIFAGMEGFAYMSKGDLKKARHFIEKALVKDPSIGWYHCIYGWILLKEGDRRRAAREIEEGIARGKGVENPAFFRNLLKAHGI